MTQLQLHSILPPGCPSLSKSSVSGWSWPSLWLKGGAGGMQTPLRCLESCPAGMGLMAWLETGRRRSSAEPRGAHPATAAGSVSTLELIPHEGNFLLL